MNFAIMEITDGKKSIVEFVESIDQFIYNVKQKYPSAVHINYVSSDNIKKHDYFDNGLYILCENNMVYLLEKNNTTKKGYLYNTSINKINTVKTWEYIPINIIN